MPLGVEVGISPGHIMLDGDPARPPPEKKLLSKPPNFRPMSIVAKRSPICATAEHVFNVCTPVISDYNSERLTKIELELTKLL